MSDKILSHSSHGLALRFVFISLLNNLFGFNANENFEMSRFFVTARQSDKKNNNFSKRTFAAKFRSCCEWGNSNFSSWFHLHTNTFDWINFISYARIAIAFMWIFSVCGFCVCLGFVSVEHKEKSSFAHWNFGKGNRSKAINQFETVIHVCRHRRQQKPAENAKQKIHRRK